MKKCKRIFTNFVSATLLVALPACVVDKDFDGVGLWDIDTEMVLMGEGAAFPLGDVASVSVGDLLDKIEGVDNIISVDEDGNLALSFKDEFPMSGLLDQMDMASLRNLNGHDYSFNFTTTLQLPASAPAGASLKSAGEISCDVNETLSDYELVSPELFDKVPQELEVISDVEFSEGTKVTFGITPTSIPSWGTDVYAEDFIIILPDYAFLEDGSHVLHLPDSKLTVGTEIVGSAVFAKMQGKEFTHGASIKDNLVLKCHLRANNVTYEGLLQNRTLSFSMRSAVGEGTVGNPGKICVSKVGGKVNCGFEQIVDLNLDDIPEMFRDKNIVLDFEPMLKFGVSTNLNVAMSADLSITPYIGGAPNNGAAVNIKGINVPCADDPDHMASVNYMVGRDLAPADGVNVINQNLSGFFRTIPDVIKVKINANTDNTKTSWFFTDAEYNCFMDYDISVPLAPGKDFAMTLTPSDISLEGASSYLKYIKNNSVALKGIVNSTLPVGATLEAFFLDKDGQIVPTTEPAVIKISAGHVAPSGGEAIALKLKFAASEKEPVSLRLTLALDAPQGAECINTHHVIGIDDLVIMFPEGITVDPLDL